MVIEGIASAGWWDPVSAVHDDFPQFVDPDAQVRINATKQYYKKLQDELWNAPQTLTVDTTPGEPDVGPAKIIHKTLRDFEYLDCVQDEVSDGMQIGTWLTLGEPEGTLGGAVHGAFSAAKHCKH
jgi:hypothetical protein